MPIYLVFLNSGSFSMAFTDLETAKRSIEQTYATQKNGATITYKTQGNRLTIATASNGDSLTIRQEFPVSTQIGMLTGI